MVSIEQSTGVSFGLTEEQKALRELARELAANKIRPHERDGDEYVINGSKTFITNAGYAAWTVVFAKTDPRSGHRGISAFVVPMDSPGVTIEQHLEKMGQRATDTSAFALQDVRVPVENRLGEEGDGFKIAMATLDFTRPGTATGAVGVAQAAYEHAVEYAKGRVTFDMPIAMHQGVSFMIADMATEIEAARLLCWQTASSPTCWWSRNCRRRRIVTARLRRSRGNKGSSTPRRRCETSRRWGGRRSPSAATSPTEPRSTRRSVVPSTSSGRSTSSSTTRARSTMSRSSTSSRASCGSAICG